MFLGTAVVYPSLFLGIASLFYLFFIVEKRLNEKLAILSVQFSGIKYTETHTYQCGIYSKMPEIMDGVNATYAAFFLYIHSLK
jgi:hypothetical protein